MDKLIVGSMHQSAGKTSLIVGLAGALNKKIGYLKPFGDRMLYRKKRLWDYDAMLVTSVFGLEEIPDDISIGFDHSKLLFMYNQQTIHEKLNSMLSDIGLNREVIFIEGGKDIRFGISVSLDPISMAAFTKGRLIIVAGGDENTILDDLVFLRKRIDLAEVDFAGVIINKIPNLQEFKDHYLAGIETTGLNILGMIPFEKKLIEFSVGYLSERLFAKIVTGEDQLEKVVKSTFIGAMQVSAALENPLFSEVGKAVITSGDRTDIILAALEGDTACVVLTDNLAPSPKIISIAKERKIPLLMVPTDLFQIAKQIDKLEPLTTKQDQGKVALLEKLIRENVNLKAIFKDE